ncbi:MAG TPA: PIG-L deacetylase family protein, partial [Anaerolineae bacterium]
VREKELEAAVGILGATLHTLGYRDSGYVNDPANEHPEAFIQADEYEAIGCVVKLIRQVRPQVVITHDETGGYFHPDHIFCSKMTTAAFHAAGDPSRYPEIGPEPYRPQCLYHHAFPRRWLRLFNLLLRLRGKDPTKMGRNQDVDYTKLGTPAQKIHAYVDYRDYWEVKLAASAQHASQGGGVSRDSLLPTWLQKRLFGIETFTRAFPPASDGYREKDLFAGITEVEKV